MTKTVESKQKEKILSSIENSFRKQRQKDNNLKSAALLVSSEKLGIHLNLADGAMDPDQPAYMASVGKIFTSVLISMLYEKNQLSFDDSISSYLDKELLHHLHLYNEVDYSNEIKIKHLLNHSSGLPDNFWPLLEKVLENPDFHMSTQETVAWAKDNLKPHFPPGDGFKYTDTNYHLLGFIIEKVTGLPFHEVLKQFFFEPLGMVHSSFLHQSTSIDETTKPMADFYANQKNITNHKGYGSLDYTGGGIVSTREDMLKFMKALVSYELVGQETLEKMFQDKMKYETGIDYGYGIMQFKTIPLLMPKMFNCWGHAGVTGAYMFYHPKMDAYFIGTFNDFSYAKKGVKFMLMKVIMQLAKLS
ncbi:serine hydrolase domain-containing protein [Evansella tamaricis]|uniref:Beta-lactamase family protein n=1 Tax=Evansella tamaricis TaxID=2069301 RepID=A0ABS6JF41_9BACI|nr:serine hydrolase [Evansella tamaricis]MBU9712300.1 beta-lactamase family protein [Evansella tamaricis]